MPSGPAQRGATLVELLTALLIAGLLLGAVLAIYRTATVILQGEQERHREAIAADALEQLHDDLVCSRALDDLIEPPIELSADPVNAGRTMELHLIRAAGSGADGRVRRVSWKTAADGEGRRLLRREYPPGANGEQHSPQVIMRRIDKFIVEFYDGDSWHSEWPPEDGTQWPQAARLTLGPKSSAEALRLELILPAGLRIEREKNRNISAQGGF